MKILYIFTYIKWGLGIGDWGLEIGDWAQSPKTKNKKQINKTQTIKNNFNEKLIILYILIF